ncbi:MAG: hypothetical protein IKQ36_01495 [Clostridia bacterium]|nr:hypothetical protein [Clostridia bacterium]
MLQTLLDIALAPQASVIELLEYLLIGLLIAGSAAAAIVLIVVFSRKRKKK